MRNGTWQRMKEWLGSFKKDHAGANRSLGFGGWACMIARGIGVAVLTLSCLGIFLPFAVGFTWMETIVVVAAGLLIARQFLNFHHLYLEAESFVLYVWDHLVRNRTWHHYWREDPTNTQPAQAGN